LSDTIQISGTDCTRYSARKSEGRPSTPRIRVLAVVRHPVGGIRSYLTAMYAELASNGYQFRLATVEDAEARHLRVALPAVDFIEVTHRHALALLLKVVLKSLATGRYDVIHSHGFTAGLVAALGNLFFRVPHLLTLHETLAEERFRGPFGWIKAVLLGHLLANIDVIQTVSFDARRNLLTHLPRLRHSHVVTIVNGVDVNLFGRSASIDGSSWRAEFDIAKDSFVFGFLGRLMPEKGYEHLVEAVQLLTSDPARPRFVVVVVNDGCYIRELKAELAARGLSSYFRFVGLVPNVSDVLGRLDSVVMPSLREACPLVAMESLVAGCPLIASRCIGLREVIDSTPALPVTPGDPRGLADAMTYLMQHHSEIKRAAVEFVSAAKERYDVRDAANALDALLRRTLARRRRRRPRKSSRSGEPER
jgi:glycosyltransferase involved in cell wall biosynthesis